jgi:glycosyltransferase involved in cell wall biosynthesis
MISVVIPACNEGPTIARTLSTILRGASSGEVEVIVVCNGCSDDTAAVVRRFDPSVRIIETSVGNKANALNLGDQEAVGFPRFYIDADIMIGFAAIQSLAKRLEASKTIAVAPTPLFDLSGCSWAVRAFYRIRCRLPSFKEGIGGSGVYGLSEVGRRRFGAFPAIVADDTFVRIQFNPSERETLATVCSTVFPPRRIRDLIAIETRADFGSLQLARLYPELWTNNGGRNHGRLFGLLMNPILWPTLAVYAYVKVSARIRARVRLKNKAFFWERDESSRSKSDSRN